jgi:hypothetical protein
MRPNFHSRRFDPRWLFPTIGTDGTALHGALDVSSLYAAGEETDNAAEEDFDDALEQIASEGCRVCPLCGATVARDGSVLR